MCLVQPREMRADPGGEVYNGMQAAAKLGIGRTTVERWIKQGATHRCLEVEPLLNIATTNGLCVQAVR